ncbi:hypothetical protein EJ04DRAFT_440013 [Polyplosphaeria fusca]|uniref:Protein kinase domain-containing protein n=1 Tax=Polyplosphaeria fusca TaxID=682080 RepID=A0A9P4QV28_9PLEO|nr:hypothetical protein EJ04DRAFT_440013 [Polyplosphaeria fusca]
MPNLLAPGESDSSRSRSRQRARTEANEHRSVWDRLSFQKIGSWLRREEEEPPPGKGDASTDEENKENGRPHSSHEPGRPAGFLHRRGSRSSRKVVPGLPRPLTFKRQNSERRDRLLPVPVDSGERRAASADRRVSATTVSAKRNLSPPPFAEASLSAPDVMSPHSSEPQHKLPTIGGAPDSNIPAGARQVDYSIDDSIDYHSAGEPPPLSIAGDSYHERQSQQSLLSDLDETALQEELEAKWILNLSMHFRDNSDREKFFITYAEEPNKWRRVTVSCDYRHLTPESLESDLKTLHYQRDKSARIYEAIRDSLPDIQFYDTVTNLKLETADGRLHVHVTEDVNEIIPYPSVSAIDHLECRRYKERDISFDSHISGFVYKVGVDNTVYIKKEIPGPDAVEEFLYEINALCNLRGSKSVIQFEGIIVDEANELIKGLLISYADHGALVDLIYDYKSDFKSGDKLPWHRREKWARQIVEGLAEIHEAGFVQGDFTLSNIVIDADDNAKIIDINRRGCPVGWEPPELAKLIESGQRISIYIGVKSDLFQLGMVLWALAEKQDEPERQERPLVKAFRGHSTPEYFRAIVTACLEDLPRKRLAAIDILKRFPEPSMHDNTTTEAPPSASKRQPEKEYIDPKMAVSRDDIHPRTSFDDVNPASSESYVMPSSTNSRGRPHEYRSSRSILSLDDSELEPELPSIPGSRSEGRWEQVYIDGDAQFVAHGGQGLEALEGFDGKEVDVCITTPPSELENSKSDDTPLSLSTVAELAPAPDVESKDIGHRKMGSKASFSDRVHQLEHVTTQEKTLHDLEDEVNMDTSVTSSAAPSRSNTGFEGYHKPLHQDSGFADGVLPERVSYETERIRQSLEERDSERLDERIKGRLWDEQDGTMIGEGVRGNELRFDPSSLPKLTSRGYNYSNWRIASIVAFRYAELWDILDNKDTPRATVPKVTR